MTPVFPADWYRRQKYNRADSPTHMIRWDGEGSVCGLPLYPERKLRSTREPKEATCRNCTRYLEKRKSR